MATSEFTGPFITALANEAISAYHFVDLPTGTSLRENLKASIADSGDDAVGIACETVASGAEETPIAVGGIGRVKAGAAFNVGVFLKPDAANGGKAIAVSANNDAFCAMALEPAAAENDVVRCLIVQGVWGQ